MLLSRKQQCAGTPEMSQFAAGYLSFVRKDSLEGFGVLENIDRCLPLNLPDYLSP